MIILNSDTNFPLDPTNTQILVIERVVYIYRILADLQNFNEGDELILLHPLLQLLRALDRLLEADRSGRNVHIGRGRRPECMAHKCVKIGGLEGKILERSSTARDTGFLDGSGSRRCG